MHGKIFTFLLASAGAISGALATPPNILAEIRAWQDTSDCTASSPDLDFNLGNSSLNQCAVLPYPVSTIELAALRDGPYQASFYTDNQCANLTLGTTVNVPGNCLNTNVGLWYSLKVTTY